MNLENVTADTDTSKEVHFGFPEGAYVEEDGGFDESSGALWVSCAVHNWPREQWYTLLVEDEAEPGDGLEYLTETLSQEEPTNKTIQFLDIRFNRNTMEVFLERLNITSRLDRVLLMVYSMYDERAAKNNNAVPVDTDPKKAKMRNSRQDVCPDVQQALLKVVGMDRCIGYLEMNEEAKDVRRFRKFTSMLLDWREEQFSTRFFNKVSHIKDLPP